MTEPSQIESILSFIIECDRLKSVLRRTYPVGMDRQENSAEHSWSLALMAMALAPVIDPSLDQLRILRMVTVHDIVEIDAGDTFCYDAREDKEEQERLAARRIFGLLPQPIAEEFMALWEEFEARATPEATFANALDRLLPMIQNYRNNGRSWQEHGVRYEQVIGRAGIIGEGSEALGIYVRTMLEDALAKGFLARKAD